jgi:hypothetical protein
MEGDANEVVASRGGLLSDAVKPAASLAPSAARDRIPHAIASGKTNHQTKQ